MSLAAACHPYWNIRGRFGQQGAPGMHLHNRPGRACSRCPRSRANRGGAASTPQPSPKSRNVGNLSAEGARTHWARGRRLGYRPADQCRTTIDASSAIWIVRQVAWLCDGAGRYRLMEALKCYILSSYKTTGDEPPPVRGAHILLALLGHLPTEFAAYRSRVAFLASEEPAGLWHAL